MNLRAALPLIFLCMALPAYADETPARQAERLIAAEIDAARAELAPEAPALEPNATLAEIARARSQAMLDGAPFSHQDAKGAYPAFDAVRAHYRYGAIGENLAVERWSGQRFDARSFAHRMVQGWLGSPPHRANILAAEFDATGIGVAVSDGEAYVTQLFLGPPKTASQMKPDRTRQSGSPLP